MKNFLSVLIISFSLFIQLKAQSVGIGTNTPDPSAQLEVKSNTKGFLPPRVALSGTNITSPIANPATGLLVYNTASAGSSPQNVRPGYYYWDGSKWGALENRANAYGDMQYWDGSRWITIPLGLNGQVLTICNGIPFWGSGSCQTTLTLQPENNPYEVNYNSYNPNNPAANGSPQMAIQAWTAFGNPLNSREIIQFDYSSIPPSAVVDSAQLYLFAANNPVGGNTVDAHFGDNNACSIQRITTTWGLPCPFSWNNPPAVTATSQAIIPQSTSSFEDNKIDVTALVKDMLTNGNNGFLIRLQTETPYNIRQYISSLNSNTAKRPKLIIYYH